MAVSLTRFSWWLWGKKEKEPVSNGSVKFPAKSLSSSKKVKRKWQSREERRVNKQCDDVVLVASDGGVCLSGSESDGPDWSIGWVEAHGPGFKSDDAAGDGFAVLVPCYKLGCKKLVEGSNNQLLSALKMLPNEFSSEGKNYLEWLSSLQNF